MEGKLFAVIALVLMMIEPLQGIQLTTQSVVGNLLFEQCLGTYHAYCCIRSLIVLYA